MVQESGDEGRGRRVLVGGVVLAGIAAVIAVLLAMEPGTPPAPPPAAQGEKPAPVTAAAPAPTPVPSAPADAAPPPAAAPQQEVKPPSFDLARISPDGTAVLAGRAPLGSLVRVLGNGAEIGAIRSATADGSWVLIVDKPLPEGQLELKLEAVLDDGRVIPSTDVVLVDVPKRGAPAAGGGGALAVLTGEGEGGTPTTRALQLPDSPPVDKPSTGPGLDVVEYGADGAPKLSGHAEAGATVRLYLDGKPLDETKAGPDGQWQAMPGGDVAPGRYTLRIDELGADGKVAQRSEVPFERAPAADAAAAGPGTFTVQPGNSLWRIARSQLGSGIRYIDIYKANQSQIRDPNLIYPGQILGLPKKK